MTDQQQPQDPAQAGEQLQDPETMTNGETQQTDQTDAQESLSIAWTGGMTYAVFSNGETQNAYKVNLTDLTCECDHGQHNEATTEACKHILTAIEAHDSSPDLKRFSFEQLADLYSRTHDTLTMLQSQASGSGTSSSGTSTGSSDGGSDENGDSEDSGVVEEIDVDDDSLRQELYQWFESAAGFNDFDPDIIELKWVNADGKRGIHVNRQPFQGPYYDLDESEWTDKDGFEDEKEKLKDSILSAREEFNWFSEPDYAWVISETDAKELVA